MAAMQAAGPWCDSRQQPGPKFAGDYQTKKKPLLLNLFPILFQRLIDAIVNQ